MTTPSPSIRRWLKPDALHEDVHLDGPFRERTSAGRTGLNALSLHSRLWFDAPGIDAPRGTLSLWMLALEELSTQAGIPHIAHFQSDFQNVPVLTDHAGVREINAAVFAMAFVTTWYPHFYVKRTHGSLYPNAYQPTASGVVGLGHFPVARDTWYHLATTWDREANDYRVYINGVLAGACTQHEADRPLRNEPSSGTLYAGHPKLVLSDIRLDDAPLDAEALRRRIAEDETILDAGVQRELERIYAGMNVPTLDWESPADWRTVLDLPLTDPDSLDDFYIQGHNPDLVKQTEEGIRVRTPFTRTPKPDGWDDQHEEPFDADQLYLWLERFFEGDICFRYEFKSRSDRGLSLLAAQASGMHREDFMLDHPRRTSGTMRTVYGENVRNYHWEYYRHMSDTRNDVASSGLIKQPWQWPLAYQCLDHTLALDTWHTLTFIHIGNRLIGALNQHVVFDVEDNPHANGGPVYRCGRFGLRCMWRTDMTFRNLSVTLPPDAAMHPGTPTS